MLVDDPRPTVASKAGTEIQWKEVASDEAARWDTTLLSTIAHYRQYPYWCEPYWQQSQYLPRYFATANGDGSGSYACVLEKRICGAKIGLIFRGPTIVSGSKPEAIDGLVEMLRKAGFDFLRFSHHDEEVVDVLRSRPDAEEIESYPFDRDPPRSLVIRQAESDEETLGSFQAVARRNIKAAEKAGFEITASKDPDDYRKIWPMLVRLAGRKNFELSNRDLESWIKVIEGANRSGLSNLYLAHIDGECVSAVHLLRYGRTAEYMLGALDLEILGNKPSPSALLHWRAMRDLYSQGCDQYNLGGPGDGVRNKVLPFKQKFRPEFQQISPVVTIVLNPMKFALWKFLVLTCYLGSKKQVSRATGKIGDIVAQVRRKSRPDDLQESNAR